MDESEPTPLVQRNAAPDLPHFGKQFVCHGPLGVLTFRIDLQQYTHDGLVMLGGICVHGSEIYEAGETRDRRGDFLTGFVTESEYMRLTNARLP